MLSQDIIPLSGFLHLFTHHSHNPQPFVAGGEIQSYFQCHFLSIKMDLPSAGLFEYIYELFDYQEPFGSQSLTLSVPIKLQVVYTHASDS